MSRWFNWQLFAAILCVATTARAADDAAEKPIPAPAGGKPVQGTLVIANKSYKLAHVAVYETKVFDDDGYAVLLSSAPIPVDKLKAKLIEGQGKDDGFIFFQPNVKVTFRKSGEVMFMNAWADNNSVSVSGTKLTGKLVIDAGRARGQTALTADADDKRKDTFDALFDTPLIVVALPKVAAKPSPQGKAAAKPADSDDDDDDDEKSAAGPKINYRDLPLPKDAADVEYKKLVQHISYKSATNYKTLAGSLGKLLAAQGWKTEGSDLIGVSAILKRKLGSASLTIFVKPAGSGSTVMIMSEGLSWEEKAAAKDASKPDENQ